METGSLRAMKNNRPQEFEESGFPCCTTAEAARHLGVSIRTVQLWVDSGALEAWKTVGGHRRIPLESLERLRKLAVSG